MAGDLIGVVAQALRGGGVNCRLSELIVLIGREEAMLPGLAEIRDQMERAGLEFVPPLDNGGFETERFLRPRQVKEEVEARFDDEVREGESPRIEMKSSLLLDRHKAAIVPPVPPTALRSEAVQDSALKSICAFLNSGGGVLLIGVADNGSVEGIEDDAPYVDATAGCSPAELRDKWELHLRNVIGSRFFNGRPVNDLVALSFVERAGRTAARLVIGSRKRLAFVKFEGRYEAFVRRGNHTDKVAVHDIEELVRERMASGQESLRG